MRGVCQFYFETGTEGCHWAFQDQRFMNIPDLTTFICSKCGRMWNKKHEKQAPKAVFATECRPVKAHNWKLGYPNGTWAIEGLHLLRDGDGLTVFDKEDPEKKLWSGKVSLRLRKSYTELVVDGMIVHAFPKNVPVETWKVWFFNEYPAQLMLGPQSLSEWEKWGKKSAEAKLKELGRA